MYFILMVFPAAMSYFPNRRGDYFGHKSLSLGTKRCRVSMEVAEGANVLFGDQHIEVGIALITKTLEKGR